MSLKRFSEESISSQSQIKSSVGRGIRSTILELYPGLEEIIDDILPKKDPMVLAKCVDHLQLLVVDKTPVFFQHRSGPWYPTLRLVHLYPEAFRPSTWQTDVGAVKFVLQAANIMAPGLASDGAALDVDLPIDAPVIVTAYGKPRAMCVGQVKMTRDDILEPKKGIAVENLHFLGDGLWQLPTID